jgi:N-glycosylase/DNA lyase
MANDVSDMNEWCDLAIPPCELRLKMTLDNGQCFEWVCIHNVDDLEYAGVLGERLIGLRQTATSVWYKQHWPVLTQDNPQEAIELDATVRDYLSLPHICPSTGQMMHSEKVLAQLYATWTTSTATPHFRQVARVFPGVRLLRQDPLTTLFSFIASSNNNIARIRQMLHTLRKALGTRLDISLTYSQEHLAGKQDWYTFPTLDTLHNTTEKRLRELGFGYRAPYILKTAALVLDKGGTLWLNSLRTQSRQHVETELVTLHGVGPKVGGTCAARACKRAGPFPPSTPQVMLSAARAALKPERAKSQQPADFGIPTIWWGLGGKGLGVKGGASASASDTPIGRISA